jgi:flagellar biosynthetic protein FliQ
MDQTTVIHLAVRAMTVTMTVSAPFLLAGLAVGLVVSIIQAATSIQEPTLSFIPKVVVTGVVIGIAGPWMMDTIVGYTRALYESIPALVQ